MIYRFKGMLWSLWKSDLFRYRVDFDEYANFRGRSANFEKTILFFPCDAATVAVLPFSFWTSDLHELKRLMIQTSYPPIYIYIYTFVLRIRVGMSWTTAARERVKGVDFLARKTKKNKKHRLPPPDLSKFRRMTPENEASPENRVSPDSWFGVEILQSTMSTAYLFIYFLLHYKNTHIYSVIPAEWP